MADSYLSSLEVAANLNCSTATVLRLARDNKIPSIRLGKQYRFEWAAVQAALAAPKPSWAQPARSASRKRVAS